MLLIKIFIGRLIVNNRKSFCFQIIQLIAKIIFKKNKFFVNFTVASFSIMSSDAPSDASPISWENSAKARSANRGAWPRSSWQISLKLLFCVEK